MDTEKAEKLDKYDSEQQQRTLVVRSWLSIAYNDSYVKLSDSCIVKIFSNYSNSFVL